LNGVVNVQTADVHKCAHEAFERLIAAIEAGKSDALQSYLRVMGRFHRYSPTNALLIYFAKPDATHVAGFRTWLKLGRSVKKNEHGIPILAPIILRQKLQKESDMNTSTEKQPAEEEEVVVRFKIAYVFDISQTQGKPLPEFSHVKGDPSGYTEKLKHHIARQSIKIEYSDNLGTADGLACSGTIKLKNNLAAAEEFSVLVHELAHLRLHIGQDQPLDRKVCETEAEAVAFVVSNAIGLECGTASSDYIQLYQGDKKLLMESLERIQATASDIISAIVSEEKEQGDAGTGREMALAA